MRSDCGKDHDDWRRSGEHTIRRALPFLRLRSFEDEAELTPVELAARDWRREVLRDLGGPEEVSAIKRVLLDSAAVSLILLHSIERTLMDWMREGTLVNNRTKAAAQLVRDRDAVLRGLTQLLSAVGVERVPPKTLDLATYLEARQTPSPQEGIPRKRLRQGNTSPPGDD